MYCEVLKLGSINELAGEFDLDLPDLTSKGSPKINIIPQDQEIVSDVRVKGELTDEDLDLIEERKTARRAELGERTSKAELGKIKTDIEIEKAKPDLFAAREATLEQDIDFKLKKQKLTKQKKEEKRLADEKAQLNLDLEELDETEKKIKDKLGNTKLFGKFLGIGGLIYGATLIPEDFSAAKAANIKAMEDETDDSFEARMRRGASRAVGPDVIAGVEAGARFLDPGVEVAAEYGPEHVKETFGASTVADATLRGDPNRAFKTRDMLLAEQQTMQDKANQQQYRQQVSPQVDDELAIQKQMNLKKQSEDFSREAERKSQLTLDEQINEMLSQRR